MPALRAISIISRAVSRFVEIGFCTWMCFFVFGADLERLQTEIGERADIDVIDLRVAAHFFVVADELTAVLHRRIFFPLASLISVQTVIS